MGRINNYDIAYSELLFAYKYYSYMDYLTSVQNTLQDAADEVFIQDSIKERLNNFYLNDIAPNRNDAFLSEIGNKYWDNVFALTEKCAKVYSKFHKREYSIYFEMEVNISVSYKKSLFSKPITGKYNYTLGSLLTTWWKKNILYDYGNEAYIKLSPFFQWLSNESNYSNNQINVSSVKSLSSISLDFKFPYDNNPIKSFTKKDFNDSDSLVLFNGEEANELKEYIDLYSTIKDLEKNGYYFAYGKDDKPRFYEKGRDSYVYNRDKIKPVYSFKYDFWPKNILNVDDVINKALEKKKREGLKYIPTSYVGSVAKHKELLSIINSIKKEKSQLTEVFKSLYVVPTYYLENKDAVKKMLFLCNNKRATNLTDLINVYENTIFQERLLESVNKISGSIKQLERTVSLGIQIIDSRLCEINNNISNVNNSIRVVQGLLAEQKSILATIKDQNDRHYAMVNSSLTNLDYSLNKINKNIKKINLQSNVSVEITQHYY